MSKLTQSIITDDIEHCFLTGESGPLEKHHIFGGNPNRKYSEFYGLWVMLATRIHKGPEGPHFNKRVAEQLHKIGQEAFENAHGTRDDFIKIFGRNYL